MTSKSKPSRMVYSTEKGRTCPGCGQERARCKCGKGTPVPQGDGTIRITKETKGRKGSGVSVIHGLPLSGAELKDLAKRLKARCGSGGTVKNRTIEIQGDHRDLLLSELTGLGYTVKKSGG